MCKGGLSYFLLKIGSKEGGREGGRERGREGCFTCSARSKMTRAKVGWNWLRSSHLEYLRKARWVGWQAMYLGRGGEEHASVHVFELTVGGKDGLDVGFSEGEGGGEGGREGGRAKGREEQRLRRVDGGGKGVAEGGREGGRERGREEGETYR